jgi:putative ABC transport system permease protein
MALFARVRNLFRQRKLESELDEEMRFHLEERARDNVRDGMNGAEAESDALRRFGNQTRIKERTRDADLLAPVESFARDISYAFRTLRKSPGFTFTAILVLALGIGANTAVFTVVHGVLLKPLPFAEPERLVAVSFWPRQSPYFFNPGMEDAHYLEFRRRAEHFETIATFGMSLKTLTRAGDPGRVAAATVTPEFLHVLRVNPILGRGFQPEDARPGAAAVVLLGDKLWRSRLGADPALPGRTITLDGTPHLVLGVMPPGFAFPAGADVWTPMEVRLQPGNSFARPVIARLKAEATLPAAQAAFEALASRLPTPGAKQSDFEPRIQPLRDVVAKDVRRALLVFAGAVVFVLLIACANVANLLLIRAARRRQEIAVRAALGASRWRIVRQLLTESVLVSAAGGALGVLLAAAGVPVLLALAPEGRIPRSDEVALDGQALLFALGLSLMTGIVFGLAPALRATGRDLRDSIAQAGRSSSGRNERLRAALVIAELALAIVLLTGTGLLLRSFWQMQAVDPGFRPENVLTATIDLPEPVYRTPAQMRAFHGNMLSRLASVPGIDSAGAVNWIPMGASLIRGDLHLEGGRDLPPGFLADKPVVSPGYFRAMGIRLLKGREFTIHDTASAPGVVIVSESVARTLWPGEDALGKRISLVDRPSAGQWLTVAGIVNDVHQQHLTQPPSPAVYRPYPQVTQPFFLSHMTFVVRTTLAPEAGVAAIREALRQVDPDQPLETVATMERIVAGTTAEPRFRARIIGAFSLVALLLAGIGVYGVLACAVAERTHEIGIRMAIGATNSTIVSMVVRRTLLLATTGITAGLIGACGVTRVLTAFLFEVSPTDPLTFASVALLLAGIALFAGVFPARRAARVDPVIALRYE